MRARTRPHKKKESAFADFGATGFGAGFFVKQQWLLAEYDTPGNQWPCQAILRALACYA
jgi:hypothetical protein